MNEVEFLRKRLAEEEANVERANEARQEAETRCRLVERERDIYKVLAQTLRSRLNSSMAAGSVHSSDTIEETAVDMIIGGSESFLAFNIGRMLRLMTRERNSDDEMEDDENEDVDFLEEEDDDDDDDMSDGMDDIDGEEEEASDDEDESLSAASDEENPTLDVNIPMSGGMRSQSRTVSISEGDM